MVIRLLTLLLFLLLVVAPASAQQAVLSNDYWLSCLPSLDNTAPMWALISTNTPQTKVRVTYSEDGLADEFTINPNQPKEYRVRKFLLGETVHTPAQPTKAETVQKRSIHIQSSAPISVQQFTDGDNNVSLSLPVPTAFLGRTYIVAAYNDQDSMLIGNDLIPPSSGEFIVIAPEDSTNVTIIPTAKTSGGLLPGDTARITLHKGETYWVKGFADTTSNDLSGSWIMSDKPVSVIAGAEVMRALDARVVSKWDYNDHIAEYMIPVEQWGTEYISSPLTNKKGISLDTFGDHIRVFAAEETNLYVNGVKHYKGTRWNFQNVTEPKHISASTPIIVVQYDYFLDVTSNPSKPLTSNSMMLLQPRHQWVKEATATLPNGYEQAYIYVTAHTDSLKLITASVNGGARVPIHSRKDGGTPVLSIGDYSTIALLFAERGQVVISGPCQFTIRNHGTRDNILPSVTYGYGSTTASTFGRLTSNDFVIRIDTLCDAFGIVVEDTAATGDGIADIQLLFKPSSNAKLTVAPYPIGARRVEARVEKINAVQSSTAILLVRSREGVERTITLTLPAHVLSLSERRTEFKNIRYGDTVCKDVVITNAGTSDEMITFLLFEKGVFPFSVSTDKDFPFTLAPGETFIATVCYTSIDTGAWYDDTLIVDLECSSLEVSIVNGIGKSPLIYADDKDYNVVTIGEVKKRDVRVMNESYEVPLTITGWDLSSAEFFIDSSELSRLPVILRPREHAFFPVSYKPLNVGGDTALILWHHDVLFGDTSRKAWSILTGQGTPSQSVGRDDKTTASIRVIDKMLHIQLQENERFVSTSLFDVTGREYRLGSLPAPIDHLPAGAYFARIVTSQRTFTEKLVVR